MVCQLLGQVRNNQHGLQSGCEWAVQPMCWCPDQICVTFCMLSVCAPVVGWCHGQFLIQHRQSQLVQVADLLWGPRSQIAAKQAAQGLRCAGRSAPVWWS